jgi:hypothetical protein
MKTPLFNVNMETIVGDQKMLLAENSTTTLKPLLSAYSSFNQSQIAAAVVAVDTPTAKATYAIAPATTGNQIKPVDQSLNLYGSAIQSLNQLRAHANGSDEAALLKRVKKYIVKNIKEYPDITKPVLNDKNDFIKGKFLSVAASPDEKFTVEGADYKHTAQSALFDVAKAATADIREMEELYHVLVNIRQRQQTRLLNAKSNLANTLVQISDGVDQLQQLEQTRASTLDDYLVAQRLVAEHWQQIDQAYKDRADIINRHQGVYYVRVRETPVPVTLPDPLELRYASSSDIVPGCANRDTPLPDELDAFMGAVLDIPAADWAALVTLIPQLPGRSKLTDMVAARKQKLGLRASQPAPAAAAKQPILGLLHSQNRTLVKEVAVRPFNADALSELQYQGARILALEDLMASPSPLIRTPAQVLHQQLDAAAGCMLQRLKAVTPSVRLAWARAAEANTLLVETAERWPGLDKAEQASFSNTRTLVELVAWWFRQIQPNAGGTSKTAMSNFVRACLMLSVNDDPQQLLQGSVRSIPSRFRVGEVLRLTLNKEPAPGAQLQLLDTAQRVIGMLRVADHDSNGTLATITSVLDATATLATGLRVSGKR